MGVQIKQKPPERANRLIKFRIKQKKGEYQCGEYQKSLVEVQKRLLSAQRSCGQRIDTLIKSLLMET